MGYSVINRLNLVEELPITPFVRPLQIGDVTKVVADLSPINQEEHAALSKLSPEMAILSFATSTESYAIDMGDGRIAGLFGIIPEKNVHGSAALWMVTSTHISEIYLKFIRESRYWIEEFNQRYPIIYCHVYDKNRFTRRWLSIMGFTEGLPTSVRGFNGEEFIEYIRTK